MASSEAPAAAGGAGAGGGAGLPSPSPAPVALLTLRIKVLGREVSIAIPDLEKDLALAQPQSTQTSVSVASVIAAALDTAHSESESADTTTTTTTTTSGRASSKVVPLVRNCKLILKGRVLEHNLKINEIAGIKHNARLMLVVGASDAAPSAGAAALSSAKLTKKPKTAPTTTKQTPIQVAEDAQARRESAWKATGIASLQGERLQELPEALVKLADNIRVLDASNNALATFPSPDNFKRLARLVLAGNQTLATLPTSLGEFDKLEYLDVRSCKLNQLPQHMPPLLRTLLAAHNEIQSTPSASLPHLQKLDISHNKLTAFPSAMIVPPCAIEVIDLSHNQLAALPEGDELDYKQLDRLNTLVLDYNRLPKLPRAVLADPPALTTISAKHNPFDVTEMRQFDGFEQYDARRRKRDDKNLDMGGSTGAVLGDHFGDQGADPRLMRKW